MEILVQRANIFPSKVFSWSAPLYNGHLGPFGVRYTEVPLKRFVTFQWHLGKNIEASKSFVMAICMKQILNFQKVCWRNTQAIGSWCPRVDLYAHVASHSCGSLHNNQMKKTCPLWNWSQGSIGHTVELHNVKSNWNYSNRERRCDANCGWPTSRASNSSLWFIGYITIEVKVQYIDLYNAETRRKI